MALRWSHCVVCTLVLALGCERSPTSPAVAAVEVSPASLSLQVGDSSQLTATPKDASGNAVAGQRVFWQTNAPTVATASDSGLVRAVAAGSATITATVDGKSGTAMVIVVPGPVSVASVDVAPTADTLAVGATVQLNATPRDSDGNVLTDRYVAWTTDRLAVARVSASGLVTALGPGNATISASAGGKSGSAAITVLQELAFLHYDGATWSTALAPVAATSMSSIWGASASAVYVVGSGAVLSYDGTAWSESAPCVGGPGTLGGGATGVWGTSAVDVFVACTFAITPPYFGFSILHYDGQGWNQMYQGGCSFCWSLAGWSSQGADAFVVSTSGMILHYDGTAWTSQSSGTTAPLFGAWGVGSGGRVFAVGSTGTILSFDRTAWADQFSGTAQTLYGVWGSSASDVFAVGAAGTILHYDGTAWTPQVSGTAQTLYGVWGTSASDVFAVGDAGTIIHYDGTNWTAQTTSAVMNLRGVWGSSPTSVFAVGGP